MKFLRLTAIIFIVVLLGVSAYFVRAFWCTRESALVGAYKAEGVWGSSTLVLGADHTFQQSASFTNQFNGKPEGTKSTSGRWSARNRTPFSQTLELSSFISLSPLANQAEVHNFDTDYRALGTSFGIEIDPGASIYYWKRN